jgi:hypothetical protein
MKILPFFVAILLLSTAVSAQSSYSPEQAKSHVGKRATVCGVVASAHYAASSKRQPTFINLDKPYPNQVFTIVIWGSDRTKFGTPERDYAKKSICVTGTIEGFRGAAEIVAHSPSQISGLKNFSADSLPKTDKHGRTAPTPTYHMSHGIAYCEDWTLTKEGEWEDHISKCKD